jgi:hypothetical protein
MGFIEGITITTTHTGDFGGGGGGGASGFSLGGGK